MLFHIVLKKLIKIGTLHVIDPEGRTRTFSGKPGPEATIRIHDKSQDLKLFLNPSLGVGEAYMDGKLTIESGGLYNFLDLCTSNVQLMKSEPFEKFKATYLWPLQRLLQQSNPISRSQKNVAHHYDLSDELYKTFLDKDMQYSCGYFETPDHDLEIAQEHKKRHLAAKLLLKPGMTVLDIGCGWGGLALYLAKHFDVSVTGLTLSTEQLAVAKSRAKEAGLEDKVTFLLQDYRKIEDKFERIVSVGMFEHVGASHYKEYFDQVQNLLKDDGVSLIHSIFRSELPGVTSQWAKKYIFPGGYSPALSEVMKSIEKTELVVSDMETLRLHYAETLKSWRIRFIKNWDKVKGIYDERFCRMWHFYLAGCEAVFRNENYMVFQIQLCKKFDTVPMTRDYIFEAENEVRQKRGHLKTAS
ncbi:MAG: class I SAM-dependent methyltransferase [Alphaproteobacteria bacterium]|jgi:cyclopropane-fatty-acyl-phospholipid synthase|nr:class I SAM-dependent methyltransferase [Alphaproteobacteria bacterium]MBT5389836.1 class I SAM-dependent methyltransferase [Alphaproteobacteria bacterium]MBT5540962.1 class I SAM-dependent methyltransferase [Alphaproteobacteria bacterium]MBT5654909.1 class I SAM-dependent methyltransferase [Alphaproteobacteria bacterium]